jgi:uncharacterized protein (DUF305 family)
MARYSNFAARSKLGVLSKWLLSGSVVLGLIATTAGPINAEQAAPDDHSKHNAGPATAAPAQKLSPASQAYDDAMKKMHGKMMVPYTNDVDVDFVRGMIPHHQGAIDQAEILLKYSKNLRLKRLAGGIIASQKREIRFMEKWLKEHDKGVDSADMPEWLKNNPATAEDAAAAGAKE